jgi:Ca2+/Na+ antiporter
VAYAAVDRPAWHEVVGIVLACAVVLVLLVRFDRAAYEAQMDRARKAIAAQQAERSPRAAERARAAVPPRQPAPRTGSVVAADVPSTSDAAQTTARPPADPATAARPAKPSRPSTDLLVVLLAGVGTVMMAVGGVLVGLGRR